MNRIFTLIVTLSLFLTAFSQSRTLPIIYIDTEGGVPVTSKETYVSASYRFEDAAADGFESVSGTLQIKGRGNYTWTGFDKKPYRIKLDKKAALAGMPSNKHWTLLAHADDNLGFMRNAVGFEIGRRLGLAYTPRQEPVEVVLNGDYIGLYFLTEKIRIDEDRVNITEQNDNATDPQEITGGWLLEIDNYREPETQIELRESNGSEIWITYHSPEILSTGQRQWLLAQMQAIDNAIYVQDKSSHDWEQIIDMESIVRFYLVQELMDGCESFHGSCYFYRDRGSDSKWTWGPLWDLGNTYNRDGRQFIYDNAPYGNIWIGELAKFTGFQDAVRKTWLEFRENDIDYIHEYISDFAGRIAGAGSANHDRWPNYGNEDIMSAASEFRSRFDARMNWLAEQWGGSPVTSGIYLRGEMTGWGADGEWEFRDLGDGQYELRDITLTGQFKVADSEWKDVDFGAASSGTVLTPDIECPLSFKGENISVSAPLTCRRLVFSYSDTPTLIAETTDGIFEVGTTSAEPVKVEYFDLSGRRISGDRPSTPGIYIRRAGQTATKVLIR